ncbi:ATP-binding cassette domain-containing protein [Microbacterium sp. No. 7]|uniref:ATP-binding cassette domain-containing protein n=1 Tax=Microbacterium sp. No. 7 TaxID=1714373 RepID=UPI0006D1018C|nr:ATP-binding cassette domain-containing protein [Microbacterium sp. No. 7]ALJ20485.1 ABC transporter ATP-binding protein [Microbacterium sp. No. 7]
MASDSPLGDDLAIVCRDLSVARRRERVVDGVTFELRAGCALAVMGATGAGKSSLAQLLAGASDDVRVDGGDAEVVGIPVRRAGRARRLRLVLTGYVAQNAGSTLPPDLTVAEIVAHPVTSRDRKVNRRALSERVVALLDELGLSLGTASKYPYELSAGMRQRVAIARALVLDPRVLIADEPYAGIDLSMRQLVREALLRRRDDAALSLLVVTNEAQAARELDADVLVMHRGRTVAVGPDADSLIWTPGYPRVSA